MFHETPVMPKGFTCMAKNCGIKKGGKEDLSLFYSEVQCNAAAVFTRNQVPGAPIVVGREIIKKGKLQAVVVNSRVSNVGTGEQGVANARRMGQAAAAELGISVDEVLMSSTGVIAMQLPIEKIEDGLKGAKELLQSDPMVGAKGIMTTDTYPKAISCSVGDATITVIGKGSGMIEPNMATMLVYILTDAAVSSAKLDGFLRNSVNKSFNMLSVDTDTSTSDTCVVMSNGLAGEVDEGDFQKALLASCIRMTEMLARDGEGATKLIKVNINGAADEREAKIFAKSMVNSPLIKTMAFGADPNVGRILMALGKCFDNKFEISKLNFGINGTSIYENGNKVSFDEQALRTLISGDPVVFDVNIGLGDGEATAYGCDLTHGYIDENAAYYSS